MIADDKRFNELVERKREVGFDCIIGQALSLGTTNSKCTYAKLLTYLFDRSSCLTLGLVCPKLEDVEDCHVYWTPSMKAQSRWKSGPSSVRFWTMQLSQVRRFLIFLKYNRAACPSRVGDCSPSCSRRVSTCQVTNLQSHSSIRPWPKVSILI